MPELDSPLEMLEPLLSRIVHVSPVLLALALVFQLLKIAAMSQVWRRILQAAYPGARIRVRDTLASYVAGVGINAVMPGKVGLLARGVLMKRRLPGATFETLTMTVVVESLVGMVPVIGLIVAALGAGILPGERGWTALAPDLASRAPQGAVMALVLSLGLLVLIAALRRRARERVRAVGRRFRQGAAILGGGRALGQVMLAEAAIWTLRLASIAAFLAAFGLDAGPRTILLVVMVQMLSSLVPVAPNGVGTQQGLMVLALAGIATSGSVLTFAIGMQAAIAVIDVIAGAAALAAYGAPWRVLRDLRSPANEVVPAPTL